MNIFKNITNGYKKIATGIAIVSFLAIVYIALIPGGSVAVVVNALGVGIGGATVKLADYPQYNNTTSDGTDGRLIGEYAIKEVPYGSYFMMTTHPDYAPNITSINVNAQTNLKDITLVPCRTTFSDVSCPDWFYVYVMYMYDNGITSGYPDGGFHPTDSVTRAQTAAFITRAMGLTYSGGLPDFPDVPPTHWAYQNVMAAKQAGIINGYPNGSFGPDDLVTRSQVAKMVSTARSLTYTGGLADFPDVPPTHWSYNYVMAARQNKIIGGYPNGYFGVDDQAQRSQMSKMVTNMKLLP